MGKDKGFTKSKMLKIISITLIVLVTLFLGVKFYKNSTNYKQRISWFVHKLKNERKVKFQNNNIYETGVEGIFEDINKKYTLPEKLYISNSFNLKFSSDGTITSFDTFVYGKNDKGKEKTYLISYDKNKSEDINLILNGYANTSYNDDKLLEPLIKTVKCINLKNTISGLNEERYGLVYYGKRSWGYNSTGIINIDENGVGTPIGQTMNEIIGYTVSIFIPGKENQITPFRYNLKSNDAWSISNTPPNKGDSLGEKDINNNEQFYLTKEIGYRLDVADKAAGSIFYTLSKTTNKGVSWDIINTDPFNGTVGSAAGIVFLNDKIGFLSAASPGGDRGDLYRTENGGASFKVVNYPSHKVKLSSGDAINVFDFPEVPYEEGGMLNMIVSQGADGDYNGNIRALYQSKDKGRTWEFVKEVEKDLQM